MTTDETRAAANQWIHARLRGEPATEPATEPAVTPSFNGGPRRPVPAEPPDPVAAFNRALRLAARGLPPEGERPSPGGLPPRAAYMPLPRLAAVDPPVDALDVLEGQIDLSRAELARLVSRLDSLLELRSVGYAAAARLGRPPSFDQLVDPDAGEIERGRVTALLHRITTTQPERSLI